MEGFENIIKPLLQVLYLPYMAAFMLFAYLIRKYFEKALESMTRIKWRPVYSVLVIATIFAIPFLIWDNKSTWVQIFVSYCVGTSLHETIFHLFEKQLKKWSTSEK